LLKSSKGFHFDTDKALNASVTGGKNSKPGANSQILCGGCWTSFILILLIIKRKTGAPGAIRTPDPLLRRQLLYPPELQARKVIEL
jgi:hypothetical protein